MVLTEQQIKYFIIVYLVTQFTEISDRLPQINPHMALLTYVRGPSPLNLHTSSAVYTPGYSSPYSLPSAIWCVTMLLV